MQAAALIKDYIPSWVCRCTASLCQTLCSFLCPSVQDAFLIKDYIPSCVCQCRLLLFVKRYIPSWVCQCTASLCQTLWSFPGLSLLLCLSAAAFLCETSETKILDIKFWWVRHGRCIVMQTESWIQLFFLKCFCLKCFIHPQIVCLDFLIILFCFVF